MKTFVYASCLAFLLVTGVVSGQQANSVALGRSLQTNSSEFDSFFHSNSSNGGGRNQPQPDVASSPTPVPAMPTPRAEGRQGSATVPPAMLPVMAPLSPPTMIPATPGTIGPATNTHDLQTMYAPPPAPPLYQPPPTPQPYVAPTADYVHPTTSYVPPPTPTMYGYYPGYPGMTAKPTRTPTGKPSAAPSHTPSAKPSASPSASPSRRPSSSPSATPSRMPSASPSAMPSRIPSSSPSALPSANPSVSSAPSRFPSSSPSANPSPEPSFSSRPSNTPSLSTEPSNSPTGSEAPSLSLSPSANPSESSEPSNSPSLSFEPSLAPSLSLEPSSEPSLSIAPSRAPSDQPSESNFVSITFENLSVTLYGIRDLSALDQRVWEDVTARFIQNFFSVPTFGFDELVVTVDVKRILRNPGPRMLQEKNGRVLKEHDGEDKEPTPNVKVFYTQTVEMKVSSENIEIGELAYLWLESEESKIRYVRRLQRSENDRLSDVTGVSDVTGSGLPVVEPTASPTESAAPSFSPAPTSLVVVQDASIEGLSMRLTEIKNLPPTGFSLSKWKLATEEYITYFFKKDLAAYDLYALFTTTIYPMELQVAGNSVNILYRQTFSFRTTDETQVPDLLQMLATLPFCFGDDRNIYLDFYLEPEITPVTVDNSQRVEGTKYNCFPPAGDFGGIAKPGERITIPFQDLSLTLFGIGNLGGGGGGGGGNSPRSIWKATTEEFIKTFFTKPPYNLQEVKVTLSEPVVVERGGGNVDITFDQTITMLVSSPDLEIGELAYLWLFSAESRDRYVDALQKTGNDALMKVSDVSEVSGAGLPAIVPSAAPTESFAPTELVPVTTSIETISMRLVGINALNRADWRLATRDYIDDYVRLNENDFDVFDFNTDLIDIEVLDEQPTVTDVVVRYNQTFTFRTFDESKVPELIQKLSSLPFCSNADRAEYVDFYLQPEGGTLENVVRTERVQGTLFGCP